METTAGVSSEHWWGWDHGVALVLAAHTVTWPLSMQVVAPELRQQPDSGCSSPTPPPFRPGAGWHMPGRTQANHLCFPSFLPIFLLLLHSLSCLTLLPHPTECLLDEGMEKALGGSSQVTSPLFVLGSSFVNQEGWIEVTFLIRTDNYRLC